MIDYEPGAGECEESVSKCAKSHPNLIMARSMRKTLSQFEYNNEEEG